MSNTEVEKKNAYMREYNARLREHRIQNGLCIRCGQDKDSEFRECLACRTKQRLGSKSRAKVRKDTVYEHYGGYICACCGETEEAFLTIDHMNNDGYQHRKEMKSLNITDFLYYNSMPEGYQVLCYNCNCGRAKTPDKICPHKKK